MRRTLQITIFITLCISFFYIYESTKKADNSLKEEEINKIWLASYLNILNEKMTTGNVKEENIKLLMVKAIATDASFVYANKEGDLSYSFSKLKKLLKNGVISDALLNDPLSQRSYFESNPNKPSIAYSMHRSVVKDKESYKNFCDWFLQEVKNAKGD